MLARLANPDPVVPCGWCCGFEPGLGAPGVSKGLDRILVADLVHGTLSEIVLPLRRGNKRDPECPPMPLPDEVPRDGRAPA